MVVLRFTTIYFEFKRCFQNDINAKELLSQYIRFFGVMQRFQKHEIQWLVNFEQSCTVRALCDAFLRLVER